MKRILAAVDFSPVTGDVVRVTGDLAHALHAEVRLIHVASPEPDFVGYGAGPLTVREQVAREYREEHRQLHAIETAMREEETKVSTMMVQGDAVIKILKIAAEYGADLIVLGSHGHGALHHLLAGSVASGVLKATTRPVLLVPAPRG